jgi:folate-binding protein YgfZ
MTPETPLREKHERAGAKLETWFGILLPEQFTDLATEYRYACETVALVDKNYRAFFELSGPDRVRYLNAIVTNDIRNLGPGQATPALLLNPQGHILAELEIYAHEDHLQVVSYATIRERLLAALDKYIIMDDVTLEDATERFAVLALEGPRTPQVVRELGGFDLASLDELGHRMATVGAIPARIVRRSSGGVPGAEFIVGRSEAGALWEILKSAAAKHGGGPIGYAALRALRLEAGIPWFGYDFDEKVIPHEAALEQTHISYTKGCYTGQEIVERVRSRGHVNRRRVSLEFSGTETPASGTALLFDGKEAGHVTGAAFSPRLGHAVGMGYVRREANAPGSQLTWPGGTARVIELGQGDAARAKSGSTDSH